MFRIQVCSFGLGADTESAMITTPFQPPSLSVYCIVWYVGDMSSDAGPSDLWFSSGSAQQTAWGAHRSSQWWSTGDNDDEFEDNDEHIASSWWLGKQSIRKDFGETLILQIGLGANTLMGLDTRFQLCHHHQDLKFLALSNCPTTPSPSFRGALCAVCNVPNLPKNNHPSL